MKRNDIILIIALALTFTAAILNHFALQGAASWGTMLLTNIGIVLMFVIYKPGNRLHERIIGFVLIPFIVLLLVAGVLFAAAHLWLVGSILFAIGCALWWGYARWNAYLKRKAQSGISSAIAVNENRRN